MPATRNVRAIDQGTGGAMMNDIITEMMCGKCKETKLINEFYKNSGHKNGFDTVCKLCHNINTRRWALKNPEKTKAYIKKWTNAHAEQEKERIKKYKTENKEKVKESAKKYSKVHAKQISERSKRHYRKNSKHVCERCSKWRKENKEKVNQYSANKRALKLGNGGTFTAEEWMGVLEKYGNKCLCCERDDVNITIDHVVPLSLGGRNSVENLQPLCRSCNSRKHNKTIDYRPKEARK